jgi:hypothetical protein
MGHVEHLLIPVRFNLNNQSLKPKAPLQTTSELGQTECLVEKRFSPSIIIRFQQTRVVSILHEGTVWLLSDMASVGENISLSGNRRAQRHSSL